ncbi:MAG TPA: hypothetical protein DDY26_01910 [Moraxellaceae bacterium]|nr:hypothetical protein [Moraxella sp.]HBI48573.1 hypothetical protein [Moraxellaceae bacterium]
MGIDVHALQLLQYNKQKNSNLGKTLTLGRQAVLVGPKLAKKWIGTDQGAWCEDLLKNHFNATDVDSIDNSDYEGASIIYDYNNQVPNDLKEQYDTVIDFGCSEHIFNVAQAFQNTIDVCKVDGTILHILPANGFFGHGFYQYSAEFFFSLYSKDNGFEETEVFISDLFDASKWYAVTKPSQGERINIRTQNETYIIVRTKKVAHKRIFIQQSDYSYIWNENKNKNVQPYKVGKITKVRELISFSPLAVKLFMKFVALISLKDGSKILSKHKNLKKIEPPIV